MILNIFDYSGITKKRNFWKVFLVYFLFFTIRFCLIYFLKFKTNYWTLFSLIFDIVFLLTLFQQHVKIFNETGKKIGYFFIPFYNLKCIFSKSNKEQINNHKRFWLVPIFIFLSIIFSFGNLIFTVSISDTIRRKNVLIKQANQQKEYAEASRKREEEIKQRVPSNIITELNNENYDFAFKLNSLCNFIYNNYDEISSDESECYYKGNSLSLRGNPYIIIINNELIEDSKIKIGDSVELLYNTFGALDYNLGDTKDFVDYIVYKKIDDQYDLECSVKFEIVDKKIETITGFFEPCPHIDYSYGE